MVRQEQKKTVETQPWTRAEESHILEQYLRPQSVEKMQTLQIVSDLDLFPLIRRSGTRSN